MEGKYSIPVTRYASSKTAGKYHGEPKEEYCGTFYYYEPESTTFLIAEKVLITQTKYAATQYFLTSFRASEKLRMEAEKISSKYIESYKDWEENKYAKNLLYTPLELVKYEFFDHFCRIGHFASDVPQVPLYCGEITGLYAKEDGFDQILCLLAKEAGIELVVLTRMVGKKQIVTEVLDARSREESFCNLIFTR